MRTMIFVDCAENLERTNTRTQYTGRASNYQAASLSTRSVNLLNVRERTQR